MRELVTRPHSAPEWPNGLLRQPMLGTPTCLPMGLSSPMAGAFCPLLEPAGVVERLTIWIKHTVKDPLHTVKDQIGGRMDSRVHWRLAFIGMWLDGTCQRCSSAPCTCGVEGLGALGDCDLFGGIERELVTLIDGVCHT
jgi:hypothetical protein